MPISRHTHRVSGPPNAHFRDKPIELKGSPMPISATQHQFNQCTAPLTYSGDKPFQTQQARS